MALSLPALAPWFPTWPKVKASYKRNTHSCFFTEPSALSSARSPLNTSKDTSAFTRLWWPSPHYSLCVLQCSLPRPPCLCRALKSSWHRYFVPWLRSYLTFQYWLRIPEKIVNSTFRSDMECSEWADSSPHSSFTTLRSRPTFMLASWCLSWSLHTTFSKLLKN